MPRGCSLTDIEKGQILAYKDEKLPLREISRRIGRSLCVVQNYLHDPDNYGKTKRAGRKKKLSQRDITHITRLASHSSCSLNAIRQKSGVNVSKSTVYRVISSNENIVHSKMTQVPRLLPRHIAARLQFARQNMSTNWEQVSNLFILTLKCRYKKKYI